MSATDDVTFKVGDASYPFVFPDAMSFPEQRELKRLSGGLTPKRVFEMMQEFDPDAWNAVMLVCMRRVDASVKDNALDNVSNPMALAVAILGDYGSAAEKDAEADAEVPLAEAASVASLPPAEPPRTSSTPTEDTAPERTRDAFGALA